MTAQKKSKPESIGIILDGNRRWATEQGLESSKGHEAGLENVKNFLSWIKEEKIPSVTLYAFSSENWKRSTQEKQFLFNLFKKMCRDLRDKKENSEHESTQIRFIGRTENLPVSLQKEIEKVEKETENKKSFYTLQIAMSYGGRQEIVDAVNRCLKKRIPVDEKTLSENLDSAGVPDPDIIIRTGGEKRLSNFLTWQSAYSEFFFVESYWPDFSKQQFKNILKEYSQRNRRFGK